MAKKKREILDCFPTGSTDHEALRRSFVAAAEREQTPVGRTRRTPRRTGHDVEQTMLPNDWRRHITVDSAVLVGKPRLRGTRLSVEFLLDRFAAGWTERQVLDSHPTATPEAIRAMFAFAADCVRQGRVPPSGD